MAVSLQDNSSSSSRCAVGNICKNNVHTSVISHTNSELKAQSSKPVNGMFICLWNGSLIFSSIPPFKICNKELLKQPFYQKLLMIYGTNTKTKFQSYSKSNKPTTSCQGISFLNTNFPNYALKNTNNNKESKCSSSLILPYLKDFFTVIPKYNQPLWMFGRLHAILQQIHCTSSSFSQPCDLEWKLRSFMPESECMV